MPAWWAMLSKTWAVSDPAYGGWRAAAADQHVGHAVRLAGVHEVRPAGDVDDGVGQRLVERHERVAVPADAGLVAERLTQRLRRSRWRRPRRVWCASTSTSPWAAHREVDHRVGRQRGEHVVVERHAGRDPGAAGAVEVELDLDPALGRRPAARPHPAGCGSPAHALSLLAGRPRRSTAAERGQERRGLRARARRDPQVPRAGRRRGPGRRGRAAPPRWPARRPGRRTARSWRRSAPAAGRARAARDDPVPLLLDRLDGGQQRCGVGDRGTARRPGSARTGGRAAGPAAGRRPPPGRRRGSPAGRRRRRRPCSSCGSRPAAAGPGSSSSALGVPARANSA